MEEAQRIKQAIPATLQFELGLLLRTLEILKSFDESTDMEEDTETKSSIIEFFEKMVSVLSRVPPLTLSAYWDDKYGSTTDKKVNIVGIPAVANKEIDSGGEPYVFDVPEIEYLKESKALGPTKEMAEKHDPLRLIQNLYDTACGCFSSASITSSERDILITVCLLIALKSGRASYLLHTAWIISSIDDDYMGVEMAIFEEFFAHLKQSKLDLENVFCKIKEDTIKLPMPETVVPLAKSAVTNRTPRTFLFSFGKADHGKLGHGDTQLNRLVPTLVDALDHVSIVKMASMSTYAVAIDRSGNVFVWGTGGSSNSVAHLNGGSQQQTKTDIIPQLLEALPPKAHVIDVSCGLGHALFLLNNGKVFSWGNGGNGRLGLGDLVDRTEATLITELSNDNITAVQCGASHSLALSDKGKVFSWGKNTQGQCGQSSNDDVLRPHVIRKLVDLHHVVVQLAAGWEHSLALTSDGKLFSWGSGYKDSRRGVIPPVLGLGHNECRTSPECITSIDSVKIIKISCGWDHCLALDSTGKILSWGSGQNGKLGQGTEDNVSIPCFIPFFEKLPSKSVHISAGCEHSAAITEDGSMFSWGHGDGGRLGHGDNSPCFTPVEICSIKAMNVKPTYIHCGDKFTMLLAQAKPSNEDSILTQFGISSRLDKQSIYTTSQYFGKLPKNVDSIVRFTEFHVFNDSNEYFKQANITCFADEPSSKGVTTQGSLLFRKKSISRMHLLSVLLYSMATASLRSSKRCAQNSVPTERIALSIQNLDIFCLNNRCRQLIKTWSTDSTVDGSLRSDDAMVDTEYAIENSDATMGNICKLIEYFFVLYSSNLDSLINRKSELATKHGLLEDVLSGESKSDVIDDCQLEESCDSVGSAELQLGENTTHIGTKERQKDLKAKEDILHDIQLNVEGSSGRIISSFEMLYSVVVVFAANVEVLSRAQHNVELQNGLKELSMSLMRRYGLQRNKECDDGANNREKRKKSYSSDGHYGTNTSATAESYYAYDGSDNNSNTQYVEYESEHSASVTEYSDEDSQSLSQSQSLSLAPSTSRRRPRKNDEYDEEGDGEGENSVGEDSDYGRNTASVNGDSQVQRQSESNRVQSLKSAASPSPGKRRNTESKSSSDVRTKDLSASHGYESDDSHTSQFSNSRKVIQQKITLSSYDNAYEHDNAVGIAMSSADGMESNYQQGNSAAIDLSTQNEHDHSAFYMNSGDIEYGNGDELADSVEMQRAIIYSMQREETSAYSSVDGHEISNINEDLDDSNKVFGDNQRFQRVQEDFDTNAVRRIRDILNSLASQCYILVDRNNTSNIFDCPLRNYCDKYCDSTTAAKYYCSMQSIFLVWESAQIVTSRGFYALYDFSDRCTVVCQVIQSPSSFLYIIPGLVNGVLDSVVDDKPSTESGSENQKVQNVLVETLLSGILRDDSDDFDSDEDSYSSPPFLTWENIVNLVRFIQQEIHDQKGSAPCDSTSSTGDLEAKYIDKYSYSASKMQELISSSLIKLFYSILSTVLDKLFSGSHIKYSNRSNATEDCPIPYPWGVQLDKLLFNIVECIAVDVSSLFTKLTDADQSVLSEGPDFLKHTFTSQILHQMIGKFLPLDVTKITVALPHVLKLATLFHSSYSSCATVSEQCRNIFLCWLQDKFVCVFHLCADMAHYLLQPEITATKLFRKFNQSHSHYLVTARYEKVLTGSLLSKSSEEYNMWASLHRVSIPSVPNYTDYELKAVDELSNEKRPINSFSGALHSSILLSDQVCSDSLSTYGVLTLLLRSVSSNFDSVDFLKPAYNALISRAVNSDAYGNNNTKLGDTCSELRKMLLALLIKSRLQESALFLQDFLLKAGQVLDLCHGDLSTTDFRKFLNDPVLQEFVNIVASSFVYSGVILLECDMMQSNNNQKLHLLTKVVEKCYDLVTTPYSLELIPNFIESDLLIKELLLLPQGVPIDESSKSACLRPAFTDTLANKISLFRQQFESKYPYIFKNQSSFSKLRASIKSQYYSSIVIKEEFLLGSKTKSFLNSKKLYKSSSKESNLAVVESLLSLILVDNVTVAITADAAIHDEIVKRSKFQGLAVVLYSLLQLKDCKVLTQKFAEKFTVDIYEKVAEELEFFKSFPDCVEVVPSVSMFSAIFGKMDLFVAECINSEKEDRNVVTLNLESNLMMISDLLSLLLVSYVLVSRFDHMYRFEIPISVHTFMETFQFISKTSHGLTHISGDATVMKSFKRMCLLQSVLRNLTLIYRVQPSVIDRLRVSPATAETKENDSDSTTHNFLHNINCIFGPLGALLKSQMASFYRHLSFCKNVGVKYLSSAIKPIELSSPSIVSNVFSPQGCFSIGFWIYIPSKYIAAAKPNAEKRKIHILSRIPETGDVNLVSLLSSNDNSVNHSLGVHLLEENENFIIVLNAFVLDSDANMINRSKAFKKLELKSNSIPRDNWVSCVIELTQEIIGSDPLNHRESSSWVTTPLLSQQKEKTTIALFINGELEKQSEIDGGRSPLHQNIVIGKIPSRLSDDPASVSFDFIISGSNNFGRQHLAESHVLLADVFWIPTSIFLSSSSREHKNVVSTLRATLSNSDMNEMTKIIPSVVEKQRCGFYDRGIPQCPPTYLLQSIDLLFNCSTKLLDIVSTLFSNEIAKENAELVHIARSVMFSPTILAFACDVLCIANTRTQEAAFKAVRTILEAIVFLEAAMGPSVSTSLEALALSVHPAGSAVHFASLQKVINTTKECVNFATDLVADLLNESPPRRKVELSPKLAESKDLWLQRLRLCRSAVEKAVRVVEWGYKITIDANVILTGAAGLICSAPTTSNNAPDESSWFDSLVDAAIDKSVEDPKGKSKNNFGSATLIATTACGGWFPQASVNRTVDLIPRKLFLRSDPRGFDCCIFPSSAVVMHAANTLVRPNNGIWLKESTSAYCLSDATKVMINISEESATYPPEGFDFKCIFPQISPGIISATELTPVKDPFTPMPLIATLADRIVLKSAHALLEILRLIISVPITPMTTSALTNTLANIPSKKKKTSTLTKGRSLQSLDIDITSSPLQIQSIVGTSLPSGKETGSPKVSANADSSGYCAVLMQQVSFLRCILVQATVIDRHQLHSAEGTLLLSVIRKNLRQLISLSSMDPVNTVCNLFQASPFKGVQLDVLKNLLKEGDIPFLEKISLRLWKQFRSVKSDVGINSSGSFDPDLMNSLVQLTALAGEVAISETKVRALTHFPSVRLSGVALERMTGRWFYEVTLLSDGLMQLGWANSLFRCDPICGQGVGDHIHSWAYDGLRSKKWNVSCEAYGRRWRLGDTVGVLVDMDLLEMRFYLNGEDLGPAFEDFSAYELHPALSLNVRQCVRLNFGQFKFLHPPNEVDGKPFKPVVAALIAKYQHHQHAVGPSHAPTSPKAILSPKKNASVAAPSFSTTRNDDSPLQPPPSVAVSSGAETSRQQQQQLIMNRIMRPNSSSLSGRPRPGSAMRPITSSVTSDTATSSASAVVDTSGGGIALTETASNSSAVNTEIQTFGIATSARQRSTNNEDVGEAKDRDDTAENQWKEMQDIREREMQIKLASEEGDEEDEDDDDEQIDADAENDGRDEEGDDDDDGEDEEGDGEGEEEDNENENDEENEESSHLNELRRQAMIESLIGMGFPVDWALRAAEHCDVSTSESAAISWIIERMELEQSKMDDIEGDSSRVADEEEFDETEENGLDYFMQRHAAAFNALNGSATVNGGNGNFSGNAPSGQSSAANAVIAMRERVSELSHNLNMLTGNENLGMGTQMQMQLHMSELEAAAAAVGSTIGLASGSAVSSGMQVAGSGNLANAGSPTRDEGLGVRRGIMLPGTVAGMNETSCNVHGAAGGKYVYSKLMDGNDGRDHKPIHGGNYDVDDIFGGYLGNIFTWNTGVKYPPVLVGQYTAKRRHDLDKQEVLTQVSELELCDILPILASCEFALCIYYARAILLRMLNRLSSVPSVSLGEYAEQHSQRSLSEQLCSEIIFQSEASRICEFLKSCFKQYVTMNIYQPDRLFPHVLNGNSAGDVIERLPPFAPFSTEATIEFNRVLSVLELQLFSTSRQSLAAEESSLQSLQSLSNFLRLLMTNSYGVVDKIKSVGGSFTQSNSNENNGSSSISSSFSDLQDQVLRGVGVNLHTLSGGSNSGTPNFTVSTTITRGMLVSRYSLNYITRHCLQSFELAISERWEGSTDWILSGMEREDYTAATGQIPSVEMEDNIAYKINYENSQFSTFQTPAQLLEHQQNLSIKSPPVLWAYWILRQLLSNSISDCIGFAKSNLTFIPDLNLYFSTNESGNDNEEVQSVRSTNGREADFLVLSDYVSKLCLLLKAADSRLYKNSAVEVATHPQTVQRLLNILSGSNCASLKVLLFEIVATIISGLNMYFEFVLAYSSIYHKAVARSVSEPLFSTLPWLNQADFEHLISAKVSIAREVSYFVSREMKLMNQFSSALKAEGRLGCRRLTRKYTRAVSYLLFEAVQLHRNISRYAESQPGSESSAFAQVDTYQQFLRYGQPREESELKVTQLSSSSITMNWKVKQDIPLHLSQAHSQWTWCLYISVAGLGLGLDSLSAPTPDFEDEPVLIAANIDSVGSFRIDDLESDTMYRISIRLVYRTLTDLNNSEVEEEEVSEETSSLYVATECEAPFRFDPDNMSPNMSLCGSGNLTIRNNANKKWSTVRANKRMSSGLHRWDVVIDRCISKNIFIGVASKEARLDNYVGCDKFGWAFLANKAVWHNKSKAKAYGELFRTGDLITVILDMDAGQLSFQLNDRPLGVAIDGLVGPLYPAFSLYNEDDQLTVKQVKSKVSDGSSFRGDSPKDHGIGTCMAEGLFSRIVALDDLLSFVVKDYQSSLSSSLSYSIKPASPDLLEDMFHRYSHMFVGAGYRTVEVAPFDIQTLYTSSSACLSFSEGRLGLGQVVLVDKRYYRVSGVSAHKMWFQYLERMKGAPGPSDSPSSSSQEPEVDIIGLSCDELNSMLLSAAIVAVDIAAEQLSQRGNLTNTKLLSHVNSVLVTEGQPDPEFALSKEDFANKLKSKWTKQDDDIVFRYLTVLFRKHSNDPFRLNFQQLCDFSFIHTVKESTATTTQNAMQSTLQDLATSTETVEVETQPTQERESNSYHSEANLQLLLSMRSVLSRKSEAEVVQRMVLFLHLNDCIRPLLSILSPYSAYPSSSPSVLPSEGPISFPSAKLRDVRDILFPTVKYEFARSLTQGYAAEYNKIGSITTPPLSRPFIMSRAATADDAALGNEKGRDAEDAGVGRLILEVEDENMKCEKLLQLAMATSSVSSSPMGSPAALVISRDSHWNLIAAVQTSLIGQFMAYIEVLGTLNSCNPQVFCNPSSPTPVSTKGDENNKLQSWARSNGAAWECILRNVPMPSKRVSDERKMGAAHTEDNNLAHRQSCRVPIHIRSISCCIYKNMMTSPYEGPDDDAKLSKSLLLELANDRQLEYHRCSRLFRLLQIAEGTMNMNYYHLGGPADSSVSGTGFGFAVSEWQLFAVFVEETCKQVQRLVDAVFKNTEGMAEIDAGELNIILQVLYATGSLVGLGLRTGASFQLQLPPLFYRIIAGCPDLDPPSSGQGLSATREKDISKAAALAIRHGIVSVFPEPALDLLSFEDVCTTFEGDVPLGGDLTAAYLYRHSIYGELVSAEDLHIQYFWAVMYELSEQQLRSFIYNLVFPLHMHTASNSTSNASNVNISGTGSNGSIQTQSSTKIPSNRLGPVDFLSFASYATFCEYIAPTRSDNKDPNLSTTSGSRSRPVNTFIYFQIIAPTALALLSPDNADITVFEFTNKKSVSESPYLTLKISIPRYSTLQIMAQKVLQLVNLSMNMS